jgi:hypothetical protein
VRRDRPSDRIRRRHRYKTLNWVHSRSPTIE